MHDESRELRFPLMAGSSLPVSWRHPPLELDSGAPVERAVTVFYGGKEAYGFHALEGLQCMVERRNGGEGGIASVGCVEGAAVWSWTDANPWRPYSHFSALVHYIEQIILTGRKPYPPERTLLTTGALAALMEPGGRTMETPHLAIAYRPPSHSLFARGPVPALGAKG